MNKIDDTTYKMIKEDRKQSHKKRSGKNKGSYGYIKKRKLSRLIITFAIFLVILADVLFSLIIFQTRKTWFIIIACVMSIPFARNLIDYVMCLRCHPLDKDTYEEVEGLFKDSGRPVYYDISITDEDGLVFIPAAVIYNNNIIAFTPDKKETSEREKIKKYISMIKEKELSPRIVVTDNINTLKKEVFRIKEIEKQESLNLDTEIRESLFDMGF